MAGRILEGRRILLLEDEFLIALDAEAACREHGATDVLVFNSPADVSDDILESRPDAAVLDVMDGGGTTLPLASRLRELEIPFIFATGLSRAEDIFLGFEGIPVVTKPYASEQLVAALAAAMDGDAA